MSAPLFLGGVLNIADPIFGQPLYIYLWLILIAFSILSYVGWRFGSWKNYKALHGLYYAYKSSSQAAFIFNKGLISELLSEREAKCIFDYGKWSYELPNTRIPIIGNKIRHIFFNYASAFLNIDFAHSLLYKLGGKNMDVEIAKKLQNYEWEAESSVTTGGIHCDLILDSDRWSVKDSPQHAIIESIAEQWNDANPTEQVHAYPKFQRMLLDGTMNCPPGIKKTETIPWSRIDAAFPLGMSNKAPGPVREMAIEMENEEKVAMSQYYLPLLGAGVGFGLILLVARVLIMKFL